MNIKNINEGYINKFKNNIITRADFDFGHQENDRGSLKNIASVYILGSEIIIKSDFYIENDHIKNIIQCLRKTKEKFFKLFDFLEKKPEKTLTLKIYSSHNKILTNEHSHVHRVVGLNKDNIKKLNALYHAYPDTLIVKSDFGNINYDAISHEYVHFLDKEYIRGGEINPYPRWWTEGLAGFISRAGLLGRNDYREPLQNTIYNDGYMSVYQASPKVHEFLNSSIKLKEIWIKIAKSLNFRTIEEEYKNLIVNLIKEYSEEYETWSDGYDNEKMQLFNYYPNDVTWPRLLKKQEVTTVGKEHNSSDKSKRVSKIISMRINDIILDSSKKKKSVVKLPSDIVNYINKKTIKVDGVSFAGFMDKNNITGKLISKLEMKIRESDINGMQSSSWQDVVSYMDENDITVDGKRCCDYIWQLPEVGRRPYQKISRKHMEYILNALSRSVYIEINKLRKIQKKLEGE